MIRGGTRKVRSSPNRFDERRSALAQYLAFSEPRKPSDWGWFKL
jgi:hypothetical protein